MRASSLGILLLWIVGCMGCAGGGAGGRHVVMLIGEDEYKTWETLPAFAKSTLEPAGFHVTIIQPDANDKNNFPGLVEALRDADVLLVSVRRRAMPPAQMDAIKAYLAAGKGLVGIRTACHAFAPQTKGKRDVPEALADWPEFDPEVLAGHYTGHWPPGALTKVSVATGQEGQAVLKGVDVAKLIGNGHLYRVSPLGETATALLMGEVPDRPVEPVAWVNTYGSKKARVFYTSLGHPDDFNEEPFRGLLLNAIVWAGSPSPAPPR